MQTVFYIISIIKLFTQIGKVNIKLMKNYKVKLMKKFNIDFPITGNLKPAIGFFIFYFQFLLIYLLIYKMVLLFL